MGCLNMFIAHLLQNGQCLYQALLIFYNPFDEETDHMSATELAQAQAAPSESFLDQKSHRKLVQLVCFLRQLNQLHNDDDIDEIDEIDDSVINTDIDEDEESISSLEVIQETGIAAESRVELRQILVDAIAFVASVERTAAHVVAVAVEELHGQNGIRFRISMNGEIPESVLNELKELGTLLSQLDTEGSSEFSFLGPTSLIQPLLRLRRECCSKTRFRRDNPDETAQPSNIFKGWAWPSGSPKVV